jgi:hypothetical protein
MHRHYTPEEIQFVKKNIRGTSYVNMTKLFNERFGLRITLKQMDRLLYGHRLRNGIGIFRPGHVPSNKGKTHKPWQGNYRPIGSERIIQGYVEIKIAHNVWERKHTSIWKAANGKVPKGHVVIFADGNKRNFAPDNLLLVSRAELAVMNRIGLISTHKELTKAGKTIADLKMLINIRKRNRKKKLRVKRSKQRRAV